MKHDATCRKLYAAVVVVLGAVVLQDVLLLLSSLLKADAVFAVFMFFTDLADSLFMVSPSFDQQTTNFYGFVM
jgi:hypothetical protein